jgi:hypothetical protein
MKKRLWFALGIAGLTGAMSAVTQAAPILSPSDFVIAIDRDPPLSLSNSPQAEGAINALDGVTATKYLNFGKIDTGIMVTPAAGPTVVQSMVLWTANDFASRDPTSWAIAGTNDPIDHFTANNGTSIIPGVTWHPIASGTVALPGTLPGGGGAPSEINNGRFESGPVLSFANSTPYSSYRILFPTVKDPNGVGADSMQVSEINLFSTLDGPVSGANILSVIDSASAFQLPKPDSRYPAGEPPVNAIDGLGAALPSGSAYPAAEGPANLIDGNAGTKYLNSSGLDSGFIVTPAVGASTVRSFQLTTANDAPARDPSMWQLFGTNAGIISTDNSYGTSENWTLIDAGSIAMPEDRGTLSPVIQVNNANSYSSYKMVFTDLKGPAKTLMQIAEASFYSSTDGSGADILNAGDPILAIDATLRYQGLETKYLNFGENNSGLIVTPAKGATVVNSLQITTANDAPGRDPATYEIYGTNSPISSTDNSQGTAESWTLISSGNLNLPERRLTAGETVTFANSTSYTSYKIIFPTVKDAAGSNSMQIADLQLFDSSVAANADFNSDGVVDGADFLIWQRGFGTGSTLGQGDANGSGTVDASDLAIWKGAFGGSSVAAAGSVPEPSSAVLAAVFIGFAGGASRVQRFSQEA